MAFWYTVEPWMIPFFAAVVLIAVIFTFRKGKRDRRNWENFAKMHGFAYRPPDHPTLFSKRAAVAFQDPGEIQGLLNGLPFRISVAVYGTSKDRRVFTLMSAEIPDLPPGLTLYRENAFLKLTKLIGAQDIPTGDTEFDDTFVVKGNDPKGVRNWLNGTRRSAILRILAGDSDIDVRDGCLHFQRGQVIGDLDVLEESLERFNALIPYLKPGNFP